MVDNFDRSPAVPWRLIGWSIPVGLLMLPLIAMQFTDEVDWQFADFVLMGSLMGIVGGGVELAFRLSHDIRYRVAAAMALVTGFLLIWVSLAVGIVGDDDLPMDLPYFVVMMGGLLGAVGSRFNARALAVTLYLMVLALVLIAAGVIVSGSLAANTSAIDMMGLTGFFSTLFLVSALLFQQSARDEFLTSEAGHD